MTRDRLTIRVLNCVAWHPIGWLGVNRRESSHWMMWAMQQSSHQSNWVWMIWRWQRWWHSQAAKRDVEELTERWHLAQVVRMAIPVEEVRYQSHAFPRWWLIGQVHRLRLSLIELWFDGKLGRVVTSLTTLCTWVTREFDARPRSRNSWMVKHLTNEGWYIGWMTVGEKLLNPSKSFNQNNPTLHNVDSTHRPSSNNTAASQSLESWCFSWIGLERRNVDRTWLVYCVITSSLTPATAAQLWFPLAIIVTKAVNFMFSSSPREQ